MSPTVHPNWCDSTCCTASAEQPTGNPTNYAPGTDGEHLTAPERLDWSGVDGLLRDQLLRRPVEAWLSQPVAPWVGTTWLHIGEVGGPLLSLPLKGKRGALDQLLALVVKGRSKGE